MARRALPSLTPSAVLRARLGLSQRELGDFLGVGATQVGNVEAGRRSYSARVQARLHRLAELASAAASGAGPHPVAEEDWPEDAPNENKAVRARLRACRHGARQLRYQQAIWLEQEAALKRRLQTLALVAAALAVPGPDDAREQAWLTLLKLATKRLAQRLPDPTARALLALRLRLLDAEATELERLLGAGEESQ